MRKVYDELAAGVAVIIILLLVAGIQHAASTSGAGQAAEKTVNTPVKKTVQAPKDVIKGASTVIEANKVEIDKNAQAEAVQRCESLCRARQLAGISGAGCISANIDGYACAIVDGNAGHCLGFYRGTPEIALDKNCNVLGVFEGAG